MKIYDTPEGVDKYFEMSDGYDLSRYKDLILQYLPQGKTLLEIGMGPGNDFAWLSQLYTVTGSDYSREFIGRAEKRFPGADLQVLDGIKLNTDKVFDALFSSKVYQHINLEELESSLNKQLKILSEDGLILHSFWIGGSEMDFDDMHFFYHDREKLQKIISKNFDILETDIYSEFEDSDSLFLIAQKKSWRK